ncbi:hypothetical protein ACQ4LE_001249 [Meloidogyne hapla]
MINTEINGNNYSLDYLNKEEGEQCVKGCKIKTMNFNLKMANCKDYSIIAVDNEHLQKSLPFVSRNEDTNNKEKFILYKTDDNLKEILKNFNQKGKEKINENIKNKFLAENYYIDYKNKLIFIFSKCNNDKEWENIANEGILQKKAVFSNNINPPDYVPIFDRINNVIKKESDENNFSKIKRSQTNIQKNNKKIERNYSQDVGIKIPKTKNIFKIFLNKSKNGKSLNENNNSNNNEENEYLLEKENKK